MNPQGSSSRKAKCGWLRKQGGMVKTWHRRWFVLNGDCLFYFAKEDDLRSLGAILLPGNKIISHTVNPDEPDKYLLEVIPVVSTSRFYTSQGKLQPKLSPNHETFLLCAASDEERQDWIKAIRKVMFASIGGAIFCQALGETMEFERSRSNRRVPYVVEVCVEFLYKFGIEAEGIFRLPGRALVVRDLKNRFDEGEQINLEAEDIDLHSVASLLKQYLRELPEGLIPYRLYQEFMNIAMNFQKGKGSDSKKEHVNTLRTAMSDLPIDSYNTLKYLCKFLHDVSAKTNINKMTPLNLATVFGPNIIRHPRMDDNPEIIMLSTADIAQQLAFMFINYNDQVFTLEFATNGKSAPVAVDDLLNMENEMTVDVGDILQPNKSKGIKELLDIRFEQIGDRRARSITNETIEFPISVSEPSTPVDSYMRYIAPKSAPTSPREIKTTFTVDGKPVPPLRRKYSRRPPERPALRNGRNSSEHSGSEQDPISSETPLPASEIATDTTDASAINAIELGKVKISLNSERTDIIKLKHQFESDSTQANLDALQIKYDNLCVSRSRSDERVKNLSAEMSKMQIRFEDHIKKLENRHKQQMQEICAKLDEEQSSRADAIQRIVALQSELHAYKMLYGEMGGKELPPLYHQS